MDWTSSIHEGTLQFKKAKDLPFAISSSVVALSSNLSSHLQFCALQVFWLKSFFEDWIISVKQSGKDLVLFVSDVHERTQEKLYYFDCLHSWNEVNLVKFGILLCSNTLEWWEIIISQVQIKMVIIFSILLSFDQNTFFLLSTHFTSRVMFSGMLFWWFWCTGLFCTMHSCSMVV